MWIIYSHLVHAAACGPNKHLFFCAYIWHVQCSQVHSDLMWSEASTCCQCSCARRMVSPPEVALLQNVFTSNRIPCDLFSTRMSKGMLHENQLQTVLTRSPPNLLAALAWIALLAPKSCAILKSFAHPYFPYGLHIIVFAQGCWAFPNSRLMGIKRLIKCN